MDWVQICVISITHWTIFSSSSALTRVADSLARIAPLRGLSPAKTALTEHILWPFTNMWLYFELPCVLSNTEVDIWFWIVKLPRAVFKKWKKFSLDLDSLRLFFFFFFSPHLEDILSTCVAIFSTAGESVGHCVIFSQLNLLLVMLMRLVAVGFCFTLPYCHFCSRSQRWLYPLQLWCFLSTFFFPCDVAPELCKSDCLNLLIRAWIYSLQFILPTVWWSPMKLV